MELQYLTIIDNGPIRGCNSRPNATGWKDVPKDAPKGDLFELTAFIESTTGDFVLEFRPKEY